MLFEGFEVLFLGTFRVLSNVFPICESLSILCVF